MELLCASLVLLSILSASQAGPINTTAHQPSSMPSSMPDAGSHGALLGKPTSMPPRTICEYSRKHCGDLIAEFCPRCDANGNFLPKQCWPSTGYCWCVNIITGEELPNTKVPPGGKPINCDMPDEEDSSEDKTKEDSSDEDKTKEDSSDEDSSDEDSSDEDKTKEDSSDEDSSDEDKTKEDSSDEDSSDEDKTEEDNSEDDSEDDKTEEDDSEDDKEKEDEGEEDKDCPEDWTRFGEQCYIFIKKPKKWAEAEFYCQFDHAHLASVHSYEEDHFLQTLTRGDRHSFPETWIGGSDAIHEELWMWSDGSKFHYENWEDDGSGEKGERCLKMNYQYKLRWAPASCDLSLPFVCAKDL